MPRKPKQTNLEDKIDETQRQSNGFDKDKTASFVNRIENLYADIDVLKSDFMLKCKGIHGDVREVVQEAKDVAGIPKKELRAVIKARTLERKAERVREDLEPEEMDNFDLIRQALGDLVDTPLGLATQVRKGGKRQTMAEALREAGGALATGADPDRRAPA